MGRYKEEKKLSDVLKQFKSGKRIQKGIDEALLKDCWNKSMGKFIVKYTDNVYYSSGILYVKLSSAPLRQELSMNSVKIKDKLNKAIGKELIHRVVLR